MASLRARHSRRCGLGGIETKVPQSGKVDGCSCHPTYSIRHHEGGNKYVTKKLASPANKQLKRAWAALARFQDDVDSGAAASLEKVRFRDWAEEWLGVVEFDGASPATLSKYRTTVAYANEHIGDKNLHEIKPTHIEAFRRSLKDVSATTRNNHMRNLAACFNKARKLRKIHDNPLEGFVREEETMTRGSYFTAAEIAKIAAAIVEPSHLRLFQAALRTGMRESELISLRWRNVDSKQLVIRVREGLSAGVEWKTKTKTSRRDVVLDPGTAKLFERWQKEDRPEPADFVFRRVDGKRFTGEDCTKRLLYPAMERAKVPRLDPEEGVERVFHSLRDTYAATVLGAKEPPSMYWLSKQLGHSSIQVTEQRYAHLEKRARAREAAKLSVEFAA